MSNTNQSTNTTNPNPVQHSNSSGIATPRGSRASAINSAAEDRGGDYGDRSNTHDGIQRQTHKAALARDRIMKPITKHKTKKKGQNKKNTHANMTIASLNMRGRYSDNGTTDKWRDINQHMKESKTNLLFLQEAHLTQEDVANIHDLYGTRLEVVFSQGENH